MIQALDTTDLMEWYRLNITTKCLFCVDLIDAVIDSRRINGHFDVSVISLMFKVHIPRLKRHECSMLVDATVKCLYELAFGMNFFKVVKVEESSDIMAITWFKEYDIVGMNYEINNVHWTLDNRD